MYGLLTSKSSIPHCIVDVEINVPLIGLAERVNHLRAPGRLVRRRVGAPLGSAEGNTVSPPVAIDLRFRNTRCTGPIARRDPRGPRACSQSEREWTLAGGRRSAAGGETGRRPPHRHDPPGGLAYFGPAILSSGPRGNARECPRTRSPDIPRPCGSPAPRGNGTARIRKMARRDSVAAIALPADARSGASPCGLSRTPTPGTWPHSESWRRELLLH